MRRAEAQINLAAITRNAEALRAAAEGAALCAVVKADGYGHGMVPSARAALAGGARHLAVATADEATMLRAGVPAETPIHVLGALTPAEAGTAIEARASVTAWTETFVDDLEQIARAAGRPVAVQVKLDTGLGRLGTRDPVQATALAERIAASPELELTGAWTHFATADERGDTFFGEQLDRFRAWAEPLKARYPEIALHAANSAAVLRDSGCHFDMVRCGVAIYGLDPFGEDPRQQGLEPALRLTAAVAAVKPCRAGESTGYGRRFIAAEDTLVATVPVGYGDGYRRAFSDVGEALIGGARCPVRGTVSMDNITVDVGGLPVPPVPGDEVVLIGRSGTEEITAEALAAQIDTINYEITCAITQRPTRSWHHDGAADGP